MDDAIGSTLETTADAVVLAFVVVIAHIRSSDSVDCRFPSGLFNSDLFARARRIYGEAGGLFKSDLFARTRRIYGDAGGLLDIDLGGLLDVSSRTADARDSISLFEPAVVLSNDWPCAFAVTSLGFVEDSFSVLSTSTTNQTAFAVVDALFGESLVLDVDLSVDVPLIGFTVAVKAEC